MMEAVMVDREMVRLCAGIFAGGDPVTRLAAAKAMARFAGSDEAARQLVDLLEDGDPHMRMEAAAALGRLGNTEAVEALVSCLERDGDGGVRIEAARALACLPTQAAVEALIRCLRGEGYPHLDQLIHDLDFPASNEVQSLALKALGILGSGSSVAAVIDVLQDEFNDHLQEDGFRTLVRLGTSDAVQFLLDALCAEGQLTRRRAAKALSGMAGSLRNDVTPALRETLSDADPSVRIAAAETLAAWGALSPDDTAKLRRDGSSDVRYALTALAAASADRRVAEQLRDLLDDPVYKVRRRAVDLLATCAVESDAGVLLAHLDKGDAEVRAGLTAALGRAGGAEGQMRLVALLADPFESPEVRLAAAGGLSASLTVEADADRREAAIIALEAAFYDPDARVFCAAMAMLVKGDPGKAAPLLGKLVRDETSRLARTDDGSGAVESAAMEDSAELPEGLTTAGDPKTSTLASIMAGVHTPRSDELEPEPAAATAASADLRAAHAARLLGDLKSPDPAVLVALSAAAASSCDELRSQALESLGRLGERAALPLLRAGLDSKSRVIRVVAAKALAQLAGDTDEDVAAELLGSEDAAIRRYGADILRSMKGEALRRLITRALGDDDPGVLRAALAAIPPVGCWPEIEERMYDFLFASQDDLRREATKVLAGVGGSVVEMKLKALLGDPDSEHLHWICIETLAAMRTAGFGSNGRAKCHS